MGQFEPVVIEREGGHYLLRQGEERLFCVPADVFDSYESDSVFPPSWSPKSGDRAHPEPKYILWHPPTSELLLSNIKPRPPLLAEVYGSHPFRSYVQAFWFPSESRLITRTYWNPSSPAEGFDASARRASFDAQRRFVRLLMRLMPPVNMNVTINAVDRYQRIAGLDGSGEPGEPSMIMRLWLAPVAKLQTPRVENALTAISTEMAGRAYPTFDAANLKWIEALTESDLKETRSHLDANGVQYSDAEFKSH